MEISKLELATALEERDELLSLVKDISTEIEQIKKLEQLLSEQETDGNENAGRKERILADIAGIRSRIEQRKKQLHELESKLDRSTINNKELTEVVKGFQVLTDTQIEEIERLRRRLSSADRTISSLNRTVDSLNTSVTTVSDERDAARCSSAKLERELNTCFYAVASKSELKAHNIVESGFLRKTRILKGDFDKGFFRTDNKLRLRELPFNSRKGKLLTNHPETSYDIVADYGTLKLVINDPDRFWSLTNYLVIQTD